MKAGHVGRPRLQRRAHVQRRRAHRCDRHERGEPGLARDGADGLRRAVPEPDAAPGRHRPRERRHVDSDGTDLTKAVLPAEIWNPDTETWTTVASLHERPRVPLDCAAASRRPRPDGRRRRASRPAAVDQNERRDLLAAVPVQGRAADDHVGARTVPPRVELRRHDPGRRPDRQGLADPLAVGHARVRPEPALPVPELHDGLGQVTVRPPRTPTWRRRATTCSSSSTQRRPVGRSFIRLRPPATSTRRPRRRT